MGKQTNKNKPHNKKEQGVMGKFHSRFQEVATFPSFRFLRKIESVEGEQISFHKGFRQLQTAKMTKNWNNYRKVGTQSLSAQLAKCEIYKGSLEISLREFS